MKTIALAVVLFFSFAVSAEELSVAAAADLNFALKEIAEKYQHDTDNTLKLSFGSSGNFFVQIQNGAPFDLFFSADIDYPKKLVQGGYADATTLAKYARGKIVLWVPAGSKLDLSRGLDVLLDPTVKRVAIANPQHAPYGRAAEQSMKKAGIYDRIKEKLVLGENISQTAQFVQTGNADIGIVALSLAMAPTMTEGRYQEVPTDLYAPIDQSVVVLKASKKKEAAKGFLDYLQTVEAQQILQKYGLAGGNAPGLGN
jgi:molybdate transport system substrate-binding protein